MWKKTLFSAATLLPLLICADPASAPIGHWKFDAAMDNAIPAIVGGTPAIVVHPGVNAKFIATESGRALHLADSGAKARNQAGGVVIKNFKHDFTTPFTIIMRLKFDAGDHYRNFRDIIGVCDGERGPGFRLTAFYGALHLRTGDGKKAVQISSNAATTRLATDSWSQLALTYDGKNGTIYLSGTPIATGPITLSAARSGAIKIGSYQAGYTYALYGAIAELQIFNRAQTPEEIGETYLKTLE